MNRIVLICLVALLTISCIVSEQEIRSGVYRGGSDLHIDVQNDIVRNFEITTDVGKISLNGYWDIINDEFTIETFSDNKTIIVLGVFEDSVVYGEWYIDKENDLWQGEESN